MVGQKAQKSNAAPKTVISVFSPAYMGVDTGSKGADIGDVKVKKQVGVDERKKPIYEWIIPPIQSRYFAELRDHSNFDHLGIFLTGEAPTPDATTALSFPANYTDASKHVSNEWLHSWPTLRRQGWGAWFIYAGYTNSESLHNARPKGFNAAMAKEHGKLHAQHIKTILFNLSASRDEDNLGSTVFMDCEGHALENDLIIYYDEVFRELRKPGPGPCQPARPGFYTRNVKEAPNSLEMLDRNPDLFIWEIQFHRNLLKKDKDGNGLPIPAEENSMILLDPKQCKIEGIQRSNIQSRRLVANAPVGVQAVINYGPIPKKALTGSPADIQAVKDLYEQKYGQLNWWRGMPVKSIGQFLVPYHPWDFDLSFVRDPRYPHANPRVAACSTVVMRGDYLKRDHRMEVLAGAKGVSATMSGGQFQPEAPLLLPDTRTFLTIDVRGEIVLSTRAAGAAAAWEVAVPMLSQPVSTPLRRSRAIAALNVKCLQVVYVARDLSLQVAYRPDPLKPAIGPVTLSTGPQQPVHVHAFTNIAIARRDSSGEVSIVYAISPDGPLLATTFRLPSTPGAPKVQTDILENGSDSENLDKNGDPRVPPTLLRGTALVAIAPMANLNLVVGVSRRLTLAFWSARFYQAWPTPSNPRQNSWRGPLRLFENTQMKVFPHTRLAVWAYSPAVVIVAAISYMLDPVLFTLVYDMKTGLWSAPVAGRAMRELPRERDKRGNTKLRDGEADATEWCINPYGDLAFGLDPLGSGNLVLMCAGIGPQDVVSQQAKVGVLYHRVDIQYGGEDWFLIK